MVNNRYLIAACTLTLCTLVSISYLTSVARLQSDSSSNSQHDVMRQIHTATVTTEEPVSRQEEDLPSIDDLSRDSVLYDITTPPLTSYPETTHHPNLEVEGVAEGNSGDTDAEEDEMIDKTEVEIVTGNQSVYIYATTPSTQLNTNSTQNPDIPLDTPHSDINATSAPGSCLPVKHFAMTKIEKTGSSTLYTIFARFTRTNNLNILTQTKGYHIDWRAKRHEGWEIGPEQVNTTDVIINHARYNETSYSRYLPDDFVWIVPIRDPVSWFKSAISYFAKVVSHKSPEEVIKDDDLLYKVRGGMIGIESYWHLPQLQWLGLDYYTHRNNLTAIREYIDYITSKIDIPMLSDQFDASLIILRRRLCWSYPDLFYRKYVVTHSDKLNITDGARDKLLSESYNLGEKMLYDQLNETWWNSPELQQNDFWSEVEQFTQLNIEVNEKICSDVRDTGDTYTVSASKWHPEFSITPQLCDYLSKSKKEMVHDTCRYAIGDLYNNEW